MSQLWDGPRPSLTPGATWNLVGTPKLPLVLRACPPCLWVARILGGQGRRRGLSYASAWLAVVWWLMRSSWNERNEGQHNALFVFTALGSWRLFGIFAWLGARETEIVVPGEGRESGFPMEG